MNEEQLLLEIAHLHSNPLQQCTTLLLQTKSLVQQCQSTVDTAAGNLLIKLKCLNEFVKVLVDNIHGASSVSVCTDSETGQAYARRDAGCINYDNTQYVHLVNHFILDIIIPILKFASANKTSYKLVTASLLTLQNLFRLSRNASEARKDLLIYTYHALQKYNCDSKVSYIATDSDDELAILFVIETLAVALKNFQLLDEHLLSNIIEEVLIILGHAQDRVVSQVLVNLIPVLLKEALPASLNQQAITIPIIWRVVHGLFTNHGPETSSSKRMDPLSERPYFLLCGLADVFFPVTGHITDAVSILQKADFWYMIQCGLVHYSALTRKRSMYLMKRIMDITETGGVSLGSQDALYWWSTEHASQLAPIWQTFILFMETLEEKQTHVIKPVLSRLEILLKACSPQQDGMMLLHPSWILCVIQKASGHESASILRWASHTILTLDFKACPVFADNGMRFFCGPFVKMLTEPALYYKPSAMELGQCPPLADDLCIFFMTCHTSLDDATKATFYPQFLQNLCVHHWCSAALVYVTRGLANAPVSPVWGIESLPHLRKLLTTCTMTMGIHFRAAIQTYLLHASMSLLRMDALLPSQLASVLGCLRWRESIQRGTVLWKKLSAWLENVTSRYPHWTDGALHDWLQTSILTYIKAAGLETAEPIGDDSSSAPHTASQLMRMCVLAADAGVLRVYPSQPESPLSVLLSPVTDVLLAMNTHAYMSPSRALAALEMFSCLLQETTISSGGSRDASSDVVSPVMRTLCEEVVGEILLHTQRKLEDITMMSELTHVTHCCECIQLLAENHWDKFAHRTELASLVNTATSVLNKHSVDTKQQLCAVAAGLVLGNLCQSAATHPQDNLQWVQMIHHFGQQWTLITSLTKPAQDVALLEKPSLWSRTVSAFLRDQWWCVCLHLTANNAFSPDTIHQRALSCIDSLDLVAGEHLLPLLLAAKYLVGNLDSGDVIVSLLEVCWRRVKEERSRFWDLYASVVDAILQEKLLGSPSGSEVTSFITQWLEEILEHAEEKRGVANLPMQRISAFMRNSPQTSLSIATRFTDILVRAMSFGPLHARGKRFDCEVEQFLLSEGDYLPINNVMDGYSRNDCLVRVHLLNTLTALDPCLSEHQQVGKLLLKALLDKHSRLVNSNSYRSYSNSVQHRQKHRMLCALFLLYPFVDESNLPAVFHHLQEMLAAESQPSLRCLIEWMMILIINRWRHLLESVWEQLRSGSEQKAVNLCSLMIIVTQVARLTKERAALEELMLSALPCVLPWTASHHFNTRVFAQTCLQQLWDQCERMKLQSVTQQHSIIAPCLKINSNCKQVQRNITKLLDSFTFQFHPLDDLSMESVLHTFPRLVGLSEDEWLPTHLLLAIDPTWDTAHTHTLPLHNSRPDLNHCSPGTWRIKYDAAEAEEADVGGDVQKKLVPWRSMLPQEELGLDQLEDLSRHQQRPGKLILVTSLITKTPNLGGLCRTSEIFGVKEFVVGNLSCTEELAFESLSVSAHKWLPIKEVRPARLLEYLCEMKQEGYTVVGAEQTANSRSLTDFKFPPNTLLVLGNEKEGIPVELIQALDICVEIPQLGVIRSLNVHVSGALLIWEYTRQMMTLSDNT